MKCNGGMQMENIFKEIFSGDLDEIKKIIESGENINIQDKDKRTPLIHAVIDNNLEIIKILIESGVDVNFQDSLGYASLHYSAQNYLIDVAKVLLENKAVVDIKDIYGNTPLFKAVFNSKGRGEVISLLLSFGADMNLQNNSGVSPLQLANTIGNFDVTKFMK